MEAAERVNSQLALSLPKGLGQKGKYAYLSLVYLTLQREIVGFMEIYALGNAFWMEICIK
jgi:hypothetical protein